MSEVRLGLRENLGQFSLLVVVNAFVGAMIGMERSDPAPIAEEEFHLAAKTAVLSFIVVFGLSKALTNYVAGRLSDTVGRKPVLVGGWLVAAPVPFFLMWAPSWSWVLFANALLGVSQGLTWSTTVIMKIDLAGPKKRGLAMGLNEFAGYLAVAGSALATGLRRRALRPAAPAVFTSAWASSRSGLGLSLGFVRETKHHVAAESALGRARPGRGHADAARGLLAHDAHRSGPLERHQAGLVNNLNDGMAWGLFPCSSPRPAWTSDRSARSRRSTPRRGAWPRSSSPARCLTASAASGSSSGACGCRRRASWPWRLSSRLPASRRRGAARRRHGDGLPHAARRHRRRGAPSWRASSVGVYRLWRDLGYADRRAARGRDGGRARAARGDVDRRRADLRVGRRRRAPHDGDASSSCGRRPPCAPAPRDRGASRRRVEGS
jgi:hypothetical protein